MHGKTAAGRRAAVIVVWALCLAAWSPAVFAEQAWIKEGLRLSLRNAPSTDAQVVGLVKTGDRVEVLERGEEWTQVRVNGSEQAWIRAGYLQPGPPSALLLVQRNAEAAELRKRLEQLTRDTEQVQSKYRDLSQRDEDQTDAIARLERENLQLQAQTQRWPEWIAGACILSVGMILGAILRGTGQPKQSKLRF
jgi:uncharacterized protein YgiM (DUF1202 family)